MLYESDVIDHVCRFLESREFDITQRLNESQRGDDIIAEFKGKAFAKLFIEAKGESSSRVGSSRYGQPFSKSQIRDHIAMAVYKSSEVLTRESESARFVVGVALPDNKSHRRLLSPFWIVKIGSLFDQAAIPSDLIDVSWCNRGAIGVERMDFVLCMDKFWFTPSRGWREITPINRMVSYPVQFEVRRLS